MSKIIDITDKLNFEEKPKIKIRDTEIVVNNDAISFIKATALFDDLNKLSGGEVMKSLEIVLELLFDEENRDKIAQLHLPFEDLATLVRSAIVLISGAEESEGETQTPATT